MSNPIRATSRDYNSIIADFNSDPLLADKPAFFKQMVAGVGDRASLWINAAENESYLRTCITRRAAQDILEPLGYNLTPQISSSGPILFDIAPAAALPHVLTKADQVAIYPGSTSVSSRRFEGRSDVTITALAEAVVSGNWNSGTGIITVAGAGYVTGEKVQLTTSGGLPSGLTAGVDYFVIMLSATTIRLAATRALAYAGTALSFASSGSGNHTITRFSRSIGCYQQTTLDAQIIGTSDGSTAWQEFNVPQVGIQSSTVAITINGESWRIVTWLGDYQPYDKVCVLWYETDGSLTVQFGDGQTYGAVPGPYPVYLNCSYGGGAASNVTVVGAISAYGGTDSAITGTSNPGTMTGGSDPQSVSTAARVAPFVINARQRFVTPADGQALALAYGGLAIAVVNRNAYGVLSAQVVGIANGGGSPSAGLRSDIAAYLTKKSLLEGIFVQFDPATITAQNVVASIKLLTGYVWASVLPYLTLAFRLVFAETGAQILSTYLDGGISAATTLINTIFGTSFGSVDYPAIKKLLDLWGSGQYSPRTFGETIQLSMVDSFVQSGVSGVAYLTISGPTFPIAFGSSAISTIGTIGLSQL